MIFIQKSSVSRLLMVVLVAFLMLGLTACSNSSEDIDSRTLASQNGMANSAETTWISIASASTAGAWYPITGAHAAVINKYVPGMRANAETGAASIENIRNLVERKVDVAWTQPDIAFKAFNGQDMYDGQPVPSLRGLMSTYPTVAHQVTVEGTGIDKMEDVRGKSIGVGAPGSGNAVYSETLLKQYGLTYDDVSEQFLGVPDQVTGLKDGNVHLSITVMPVPTAAFTELGLTNKIKLLPLSPEMQQKVADVTPGFYPFNIPAGTYPGQDKDVPTMAWLGLILADKDMSEEHAYSITKAIWEHRDEWKDAHSVANSFVIDNALKGMTVPLHVGAVKYYKKIGFDIPSELIPPEAK